MITQDKPDPLYEQQIDLSKSDPIDSDEEILRHAVLKLSGQVVGIVTGITAALVIFVATNWLVIKGGDEVGPHLSLLGQFFYGYSVTFTGSFIGAAYGFILGYVSGLFIGWFYNAVVLFRNPRSRK